MSSGRAFQAATLTENSCTGIEWKTLVGYLATPWKPMRSFMEMVAQSAASTTPLSSAENTSPPGSTTIEAPSLVRISAVMPCGERNLTPLKSSIFWIGFLETIDSTPHQLTPIGIDVVLGISLAQHLQAAAMLEPGLGLVRMLIAEHEIADHGQAGILAREVAGPGGVRLQDARARPHRGSRTRP